MLCVMPDKIPLSVVVVTKNEERNLPRCLAALERFDEVIVVDSSSGDKSREISESFGAAFVNFEWNGQYPKKRQWCLDHLPLKHDRVFFVDADEEMTTSLIEEIAGLNWKCAGYFVKGAYVIDGKALRFGLQNNKLCLFDRTKIGFPIVDDLNIVGMGEIEGHYQPVFKSGGTGKIGSLKNALRHHAMEDGIRWQKRHDDYAIWESLMRSGHLYPSEGKIVRRVIKAAFSILPFKPYTAFLHSYIVKGGFLDGREGFILSRSRFDYYQKVCACGDRAQG